MSDECIHTDTIREVTPSALGFRAACGDIALRFPTNWIWRHWGSTV
jgi:hypothetical protein